MNYIFPIVKCLCIDLTERTGTRNMHVCSLMSQHDRRRLFIYLFIVLGIIIPNNYNDRHDQYTRIIKSKRLPLETKNIKRTKIGGSVLLSLFIYVY